MSGRKFLMLYRLKQLNAKDGYLKQILQNLKSGKTELVEVPCPHVRVGHLLIQTSVSLVSSGTERMLVEFGHASLIQKARQKPDKVKMVLDKIKRDGLLPTLEAVFNKLGQPLPLGYCNVGHVIGVGKGATGFKLGDRVASNGPHAEIVCVPKNLCDKIPTSVTDDAAAFTVIGAIGLQGIRLLKPTFGETVVVIGLGLIGLIAVQILRAMGARLLVSIMTKQRWIFQTSLALLRLIRLGVQIRSSLWRNRPAILALMVF